MLKPNFIAVAQCSHLATKAMESFYFCKWSAPPHITLACHVAPCACVAGVRGSMSHAVSFLAITPSFLD